MTYEKVRREIIVLRLLLIMFIIGAAINAYLLSARLANAEKIIDRKLGQTCIFYRRIALLPSDIPLSRDRTLRAVARYTYVERDCAVTSGPLPKPENDLLPLLEQLEKGKLR